MLLMALGVPAADASGEFRDVDLVHDHVYDAQVAPRFAGTTTTLVRPPSFWPTRMSDWWNSIYGGP